MVLIGLAGRAGSGKNSAADAIALCAKRLGMHPIQYAFARRLKLGLQAMLGIDIDSMDRAEKEAPLNDVPGRPSPRYLAQTLGTEWGRAIHPDLWVYALQRDMVADGRQPWRRPIAAIITDCRYPNELAAIREMGGESWWIERDGVPVRAHASESAIGPADCARTIRNFGTLDDLKRDVTAAWDLHIAQRGFA